MNEQPTPGPGGKSTLAVLGISALAVICCGGPALVAAGALTAAGAFFGNPWVIAIGAALVVGLVVATTRRSRENKANCCAPGAGDAKDRGRDSTNPS